MSPGCLRRSFCEGHRHSLRHRLEECSLHIGSMGGGEGACCGCVVVYMYVYVCERGGGRGADSCSR